MTFENYQNCASTTAKYPNIGENFTYVALGLGGEAGEILNKYKKVIRDKEGVLTEKDKEDLASELGDVLWYVSQCCTELGVKLENVAQNNLDKLLDRKKRNVISGNGDNR